MGYTQIMHLKNLPVKSPPSFPSNIRHGNCAGTFWHVTLQEAEAELYDPDDPNSDWGQAVQEALQEPHFWRAIIA